jgi:quercetin dioxygenase-like cupin family protein
MDLQKKRFDSPDEVRPMADKGSVDLVAVGDGMIGRATFEPGWRWSEHVKPIAGTDSCQAAHIGYVVSGHQMIQMDDGTELELGPGDVVAIPPGHDAWVVGGEPCVVLDFAGMGDYAKPHS